MGCCTTTVFTRQETLCEKIESGTIARELCRMANISITVLTTLGERIKYPWGQYTDALCKGCVIPCNTADPKCGCTLSGTALPTEITGVKFNEGDTYAQINEAGEQIAAFVYTDSVWVAETEKSDEVQRKGL